MAAAAEVEAAAAALLAGLRQARTQPEAVVEGLQRIFALHGQSRPTLLAARAASLG